MADKKITQLTNITGANLVDADEFVVVDISADETKAITLGELKEAFDSGSGFVRITGDTMTGDLNFGDNDKAIFGAGSDLQIYSDGITGQIAGDVNLTGTLTSDGLTVDGNTFKVDGSTNRVSVGTTTTYIGNDFTVGATSPSIVLDNGAGTTLAQLSSEGTGTNNVDLKALRSGNLTLGTNNTDRVNIASNGDISFYEDTGTTPKFFWDASAESLGVGTTSPSVEVSIAGSDPQLCLWEGNDGASSSKVQLGTGAAQGFINVHKGDGTRTVQINSDGDSYFNGGNVGIGTSSPSQKMTVGFADNGTDGISFRSSSYANLAKILVQNETSSQNGNLQFYTRSGGDVNEAMRIDSSGNVGIGDGTLAHTSMLHIYKSGATADLALQSAGASGRKHILQSKTDGALAFYDNNAASERMRIDSSGRLLVGKTASGISNTGVELRKTSNDVLITTNGAESLYLNRLNSDGGLAEFRKDGAVIGTIGAASGTTYITGTASGLVFNYGRVGACNTSGGLVDGTTDLGNTNNRFQDVYATNGTIQTSDANEKQDIEELTDAERRVAVAAKGLLRKFRWKSAVEEKGDDARIHFGIIAQDLQDAFAAEGLDAGRYSMFIHSTWTDEETGEEKSRMGVRYSELLAFIIAAI